jgi:HlyD family secretion protein
MTATAEVIMQQVTKVLTVPNAALRYAPPAKPSSGPDLMSRLWSRRPQYRAASKREETGSNRKVWIVKDGVPTPVPVVAGVSDGQRTEILRGAIQEGQGVIVDSTTMKR